MSPSPRRPSPGKTAPDLSRSASLRIPWFAGMRIHGRMSADLRRRGAIVRRRWHAATNTISLAQRPLPASARTHTHATSRAGFFFSSLDLYDIRFLITSVSLHPSHSDATTTLLITIPVTTQILWDSGPLASQQRVIRTNNWETSLFRAFFPFFFFSGLSPDCAAFKRYRRGRVLGFTGGFWNRFSFRLAPSARVASSPPKPPTTSLPPLPRPTSTA